MRIKQSFCYPIFRPEGMSLDELFKTAKEIGYKATELWDREDIFLKKKKIRKR